MKTTTLRKIRECNPCISSWTRLLEGLGKSEADDEPLPYSKILGICGLHDALWATRTETDFRWVQELALRFARHVGRTDRHFMDSLYIVDRFLRGEASREELDRASRDIRTCPRGVSGGFAAGCAAAENSESASECAASTAYHSAGGVRGLEHLWQEDLFLEVVG